MKTTPKIFLFYCLFTLAISGTNFAQENKINLFEDDIPCKNNLKLEIANDNSNIQIVISGNINELKKSEEIFINNENIFFIDGFEYKSWVNKINTIFNDDSTIRKISENAKKTVLENYKLKKLYDFLNQIAI